MKVENVEKVSSLKDKLETIKKKVNSWETSTRFTDTQVKTDGDVGTVNLVDDIPDYFFEFAKVAAIRKLNRELELLLKEVKEL